MRGGAALIGQYREHWLLLFFVGKYALNLGLQDSNLDSCTNEELDLNVVTIGDAMQAEGYTTHMIGKFSLRFPLLKVAIQ